MQRPADTLVAFLGTGLMGRPMAARLLAAGYPVTVFNRTAGKASPLAAEGARVAATPREALAGAAAACLMVRDAAAVRELLGGPGDLPPLGGTAVLQMSTIAPGESRDLEAAVRAAGGSYLEAPVLGSVPQAEAGSLLVLGGASEADWGRWQGLLATFGEARRIGEVGSAATAKLAFNQLIATQAAGFSLSLGMVRRHGIDVGLFMEILRRSAFHAATFDVKLPQMLARDFSPPRFPARLLLKDIDLVRATAADLGLATDAIDGVRALVLAAVEAGHGDEDYSALYSAIDPPGDAG